MNTYAIVISGIKSPFGAAHIEQYTHVFMAFYLRQITLGFCQS